MEAITLMVAVFVVVFIGGAIGLQLKRVLPEGWTTGGAKDMTGAVVGLVTLLLALVLGLLIWTAFGVFSTQKASIQTLAVNGLKFDQALADYGPETEEGRRIFRQGLKATIDQIWDPGYDGDFVIKNYGYALANLKDREAYLSTLKPTTDQQREAKAGATVAAVAIGQTRLQLALALVDPISYPLLTIVVAWAVCLFCGYGLMSKSHPMSYVVLAVGAMAIASAMYSIADLSSPYTGLFTVSPAPIVDVLKAVDEAAKPGGAHR
jgi:hypothetical protein